MDGAYGSSLTAVFSVDTYTILSYGLEVIEVGELTDKMERRLKGTGWKPLELERRKLQVRQDRLDNLIRLGAPQLIIDRAQEVVDSSMALIEQLKQEEREEL
jgi:hypothetical protein